MQVAQRKVIQTQHKLWHRPQVANTGLQLCGVTYMQGTGSQ